MRLHFYQRFLLALSGLLFFGSIAIAQDSPALAKARQYLTENAAQLGLSESDIADLKVTDEYTSRHNGVTHLYLLQRHAGIEVYQGVFNLNLLPDGRVLHVGNRLVPGLAQRTNTTEPQLAAAEAVRAVIEQFNVATAAPVQMVETGRPSKNEVVFAHEGLALEPIKTKLVFEQMPNKNVRLAWLVELYEISGKNWWNVRVDALTGDVLKYHNQVIHCDFGSPNAECAALHTHHHSATNLSNTAMINASNAYFVLPLGVESPNHGVHELVVNPADEVASPFGWHDVDGEPGHDFTITRGNNVHAYQDVFSTNNSAGDEPDGGDSLVFDFPFSADNNFPYTQVDAATTNLFFWNNLMHDIWYQYGFDEVSGNFQANNYGNGGIEGDYVRAECLDGSGTNNANFGTGADGSNARMQMYFWGGGSPPAGSNDELIVNGPVAVAGTYDMRLGGFGGALPPASNPLTAQVVLADDGVGTASDGCEDLVNGADLVGKIAMIDRGNCEFGFKALAAENAGAIAVIICNNVPDPALMTMGAGAVGAQVSIPTVMVSLEDCNTIKMGLPDLEVTLVANQSSLPNPGPQGIDGDFDNGIIAHEYGHGISIRMTGGPNTGGCLSSPEQPGEGWSDWFGLVISTTAANSANDIRGIGTFAIDEPTNGVGIRTYPYTRNMGINPHTYANINNESVPHGVGSVWCAMIWDLYWNLIDVYGYDEDLYYGTGGNNIAMQLVIDGIKLQACNPSFIDCRDAILAADQANFGGANQCLIWSTFARRGLGVNAQAGGVEDFAQPVLCSNAIGIEKTGPATAEVLDVVTYTLNIANGIADDLSDVTITDILPTGTIYVEGSYNCGTATVSGGVLTLTLDNVASGTIAECSYQVQIEAGSYSEELFTEKFESGLSQWEISNGAGSDNWSLSSNSNSGNFAAFANNPDGVSDQYIAMETPFVVAGEAPTLVFWHSYDTEFEWDGGVVEILVTGQTDWQDLGAFMTSNGYDGPVNDNPDSPISGRPAFHGSSNGYIFTQIDLSSFLGEEVLIRFRFASDAAVGGTGWYVDDMQLYGNYVTIENVACMENQDGEEICSNVVTLVSGIVSSTNDAAPSARIALYPNPTSGLFTLQVDTEVLQPVTLKIFSADGRLLQSSGFNANDKQQIDLSAFGQGVYFAKITAGEMQTVRKVIVK